MKATFVELPAFSRHRDRYLDDRTFRDLQVTLMANPEIEMSTKKTAKRPSQRRRGKSRDLFREISEGLDALAEVRQGKRTLRTHVVEIKTPPRITPSELLALRERHHLSRALFAAYLRTNVRTLENWEQGRAKPNAQASLLIRLVERYPDTVQRLAAV